MKKLSDLVINPWDSLSPDAKLEVASRNAKERRSMSHEEDFISTEDSAEIFQRSPNSDAFLWTDWHDFSAPLFSLQCIHDFIPGKLTL